jgi:hypothetical protein
VPSPSPHEYTSPFALTEPDYDPPAATPTTVLQRFRVIRQGREGNSDGFETSPRACFLRGGRPPAIAPSSKSFLPCLAFLFFSAAFNRAFWLKRKTRLRRGLIVRGMFLVDGEGDVVIDVWVAMRKAMRLHNNMYIHRPTTPLPHARQSKKVSYTTFILRYYSRHLYLGSMT